MLPSDSSESDNESEYEKSDGENDTDATISSPNNQFIYLKMECDSKQSGRSYWLSKYFKTTLWTNPFCKSGNRHNFIFIFIILWQPLLKMITKWANKKGENTLENEWRPIDDVELIRFMVVLILIGVCKSKNEEISQLWNKENGRNIFNTIMSRTRFQSILCV